MVNLTLRETGATPKGSPLSNAEIDQNFINLKNAVEAVPTEHASLSGRLEEDQHPIAAISGLQTALSSKQDTIAYTPENTANKGIPGGYAPLNENGLVPASFLPGHLDDVQEYANLAAFPETGIQGVMYVAIDIGKLYRWTGSSYAHIPSGAVDSVNGQSGVVELDKADIGLGNVDNTSDLNKPVSTAVQTALNGKADAGHSHTLDSVVTAQGLADPQADRILFWDDSVNAHKYLEPDATLAITGTQLGVKAATTSQAGTMSASDKIKLDNIADSANNYAHPANHPASIITQDANNRFVTDAEKTNWNAKQDALVSGTSIKTVNSTSLLGSGDITTGDVTGQASSVDSEIALFSGTGGKTVKRATGSGLAKLTSGVLSTATAGTDYVAPNTAQSWTAAQNFTSDIKLTGSSGTSGQVLTSAGPGAAPTWTTPATGSDSITITTRTSDTILGAGNVGTLILYTSGTFTQTFTAAATLGSGWFVYIRNAGTGIITLNPNASETIDGLTTALVYPGESFMVLCNGTNFYTVGRGKSVTYSVSYSSVTSWTISQPFTDTEVYSFDVEFSNVIPSGGGLTLIHDGAGGGWYGGCIDFSTTHSGSSWSSNAATDLGNSSSAQSSLKMNVSGFRDTSYLKVFGNIAAHAIGKSSSFGAVISDASVSSIGITDSAVATGRYVVTLYRH